MSTGSFEAEAMCARFPVFVLMQLEFLAMRNPECAESAEL